MESFERIEESGLKDRVHVQWDCFVQDTSFEIQIYPKTGILRHESGETKHETLDYMDCPPPGWELCELGNEYLEKHPHLCISVPGQTEWSQPLGFHLDLNDRPQQLLSKFPVPGNQLALIVKTYHGQTLTLGSFVRVYGILELPQESGEHWMDQIPILHCVRFEELSSQDLIPNYVIQESTDLASIAKMRDQAIGYIAGSCYGDRLVAEYCFLQLFSSVLDRSKGLPVGSFPLNISNVQDATLFLKRMRDLTPLQHTISLDLKSLNEAYFAPDQVRFPDQDHLASGQLQLMPHTWIMINETQLTDGKLNERGIENLQHLQTGIQDQTIKYKLHFGHMEREIDYQFCVISEGKSLLKLSTVVPLVKQEIVQQEIDDLDYLRSFISKARSFENGISDSMQATIAQEFSQEQEQARQENRNLDDGSQLLHRLGLAQLIAKSKGFTTLDEQSWREANLLEQKRIQRLSTILNR
ncbi:hypothetical protein EDD86DRAFT_277152 [Gorgonomyces haynaldii]|nr:hypothetical protein EDD86DRAFT_277152 [Gorgonomyces haynaldii]